MSLGFTFRDVAFVGALTNTPMWTPAAITTALWLDASDTATLFDATSGGSLPGSDGAIARWEDKSGNDRHLTQATSGNRPTRKNAELNGRDMLRLDGSNDFLSGTVQDLTAFTVIFVSKNLSGSTGASPISYADGTYWTGSSAESNAGIIYQRTGAGNVQYGVQGTSVPYNATGRISVVRCTTTEDNAWIDGTILAVDDPSIYTLSLSGTFNVGRREAGPVYTSGDIGEIVLVASALSTDDREKAEGYLAHKWGLTANLPSDHPYKTTAPIL